jgi:hypothetical protein
LEKRRYRKMMTVAPTYIHSIQQKCTDARSKHIREQEERQIRQAVRQEEKVEKEKWRMLRGGSSGGVRLKKRKGGVAVHAESGQEIDDHDDVGGGGSPGVKAGESDVGFNTVPRSKSLRILQSLQSFASLPEEPQPQEMQQQGDQEASGIEDGLVATTVRERVVRPLRSFVSGSFEWASDLLSSMDLRREQTYGKPGGTRTKRSTVTAIVETEEEQEEIVQDAMERFVKRKESLRKQASTGAINVPETRVRPASAPISRPSSDALSTGPTPAEPIPNAEPPTEVAGIASNQQSVGNKHTEVDKPASTFSRPKSAGNVSRRVPVTRQRSSAFTGSGFESRRASTPINTATATATNAITVSKVVGYGVLAPTTAPDVGDVTGADRSVSFALGAVPSNGALGVVRSETAQSPPLSSPFSLQISSPHMEVSLKPHRPPRREKKRVKEEKLKKYPHLFLTSDGFLPFGPPKEEYAEWGGAQQEPRAQKKAPRHKASRPAQRPIKGHRLQPLVSGRPVFKPF